MHSGPIVMKKLAASTIDVEPGTKITFNLAKEEALKVSYEEANGA